MPKKKVVKPTKKSATKKAVVKSAVAAKVAKKTRKAPATKRASKVKAAEATPEPVKSVPASNSSATNGEVSLGRPLVTQEEKLYMLFHDDYQARQVFEFLRVDHVKDLEQFSPQQIVHMMSKPLRLTVDRIRQRLAQYKRSLKDDEQFAADYLKKAE